MEPFVVFLSVLNLMPMGDACIALGGSTLPRPGRCKHPHPAPHRPRPYAIQAAPNGIPPKYLPLQGSPAGERDLQPSQRFFASGVAPAAGFGAVFAGGTPSQFLFLRLFV